MKHTTTHTESDTPRAWVGCLGCYNNGELTGKWLDAEEAADLWAAELTHEDGTCVECGADEFWCMDHENLHGASALGEMGVTEFIERAELATAINEHDNVDALRAFLDNENRSGDAQDIEEFESRFMGQHDSREAWAEEYLEDSGLLDSVPEALRFYIDTKAYARDAGYSGDVSFIAAEHGGVYVFSN